MLVIKCSSTNVIGKVYISMVKSDGSYDIGRTPKTWKSYIEAKKAYDSIANVMGAAFTNNFAIAAN